MVILRHKNQKTTYMRTTSTKLIILALILASCIGIIYFITIISSSKEDLQAIDRGTGALTVKLCIGPEDSVYTLDRTLRTIEYRLDRAGFNTCLNPEPDGLYSLTLDNVSDTALVKHLITSNINIGLWETVNSDLYKKITDTTNAQIKALLGVFSPYEYGDNSCAWGSAFLEDTAIVNQIIKHNIIDTLFDNVVLLWGRSDYYDSNYYLYTLSPARDGGPSILINDYVEDVDIIENPDYPGFYSLDITLNTEGAHLWSAFTRNNISENIAFTINDMVCMSQFVDTENTSGKLELKAEFSEVEAQYSKAILMSGNLQLPVQIIEEQFIPMSDTKYSAETKLILAGGSLFVLFSFLIYQLYILFRKKNSITRIDETPALGVISETATKRGKLLYRILCILFIVFSIAIIIKALTGTIVNLSDLVQGITLIIISVAFCMKKRYGWFFMQAFWVLLIAVAFVTFCLNISFLGLFLFLLLIAIPIIVALNSRQIKNILFGITATKAELIKLLIIPTIIMAAIILLLPKLVFLVFF